MRICKNCNIEKPLTDFHKHKGSNGGYRNKCKVCIIGHEPHKKITEGLKKCKCCEIEKDVSEYSYTGGKKYLQPYCEKCRNKKSWKSRGYKPKSKLKKRAEKLKLKYGITLEDYDNMFKSQNECCKICGVKQDKVLSVDHCHTTGKVRGLLCFNCNTGLGAFKDNIESLKNAIIYLEN